MINLDLKLIILWVMFVSNYWEEQIMLFMSTVIIDLLKFESVTMKLFIIGLV